MMYFITGTDTGVGKTYVTKELLKQYAQNGKSAVALKPISAGDIVDTENNYNEDALGLLQAAKTTLRYEDINYKTLSKPASPHIAAFVDGVHVTAKEITDFIQAKKDAADVVLVEGAGGWHVPINDRETLADVAIALNVPVILVVGIRLGCINHTLLTVEAIHNAGLTLHGWIANLIDPNMDFITENIETIQGKVEAPLLEVIPFG